MYAVLTPKHEDTVELSLRMIEPIHGVWLISASSRSLRKSHTRFMMSSLSRTKGLIVVNIRLFTGSTVKREWSFFLLWALNPRSQGTMPTGMIRVRIKCEQIDYLAAKGVRETSQFPRLDAWINLIHNTMKEAWTLTVKKCHHSLDYWIIVARIIEKHHSSKFAAYGIYESIEKTNLRRYPSCSFARFLWQAARISFE